MERVDLVTRIETKWAKRAPTPAPPRALHPAYWLIAKSEAGRIEVLTFDGEGTLPVFSHEEEAEQFLWAGHAGGEGWRIRESTTGELISVLCGPCAGVKEVALDPLPEMVARRAVRLVSLDRERFIEEIMATL